jgi:hypothetical protein
LDTEIAVGRGDPIEKGLPNSGGLLAIQSLKYHGDTQAVVGAKGCGFTPMRIE